MIIAAINRTDNHKMKLRYETQGQRPISTAQFRGRVLRHAFGAVFFLTLSIAIGMIGYIAFEHMNALDAFLNTAMLIGGMGPVNPPVTPAGKLFAGFYALYAGLVFVVSVAMILAPVFHRLLHQFHWDDKD
jgi:hypothetical protein